VEGHDTDPSPETNSDGELQKVPSYVMANLELTEAQKDTDGQETELSPPKVSMATGLLQELSL
jgi:hypothetical protein